jgi:hypothetical protein
MARQAEIRRQKAPSNAQHPTSNIQHRTEGKPFSLVPKQRELLEEYRSKLSTFVPTTTLPAVNKGPADDTANVRVKSR